MRPPSAEPRDLLRGPADAGAAARRRRRRPPPAHRSAVRLGHLAHDRQAEPGARAGRAPRRRGRSGRRPERGPRPAMPGPRSRTVSSPSRRRTSTTRARRAPLGRVVEQVGDGAIEPRRRRPARARARARSSNVDAGRVPARALDRGGDQPVEPHVLGRGASGSSSRASSTRSPTSALSSSSWATRSARSRSRSLGVGRAAAGQHLEVRAQRGERRAQLVRGVGDELALRALTSLERLEHRVERGRQARDLVLALRRRSAARGRACVATCSAVSVSSTTGRIAVRVASRESTTASAMPASASSPSAQRSVPSARSTSVSGRATKIAEPVRSAADVARARALAVDRRGRRRTARACPARPRAAPGRRRAAAGRSLGRCPTCRRQTCAHSAGASPGSSVSWRRRPRARARVAAHGTRSARASSPGRAASRRSARAACRARPSRRAREPSTTATATAAPQDSASLRRKLTARAGRSRRRGPCGCSARLAVRLELAAQVADVDLERVRARPEVVAPHVLEDLRAGEDLARVVHQQFQQQELGAGELDAAARRGGRCGRPGRARCPRSAASSSIGPPLRRSSARRRAPSSSSANGLTR